MLISGKVADPSFDSANEPVRPHIPRSIKERQGKRSDVNDCKGQSVGERAKEIISRACTQNCMQHEHMLIREQHCSFVSRS